MFPEIIPAECHHVHSRPVLRKSEILRVPYEGLFVIFQFAFFIHFHTDDMVVQFILQGIYDDLKSLSLVMAYQILHVFQEHNLRHRTVNDFRNIEKYGSLRDVPESLSETDFAERLTREARKQNIILRPRHQLLECFIRHIVSGIITEQMLVRPARIFIFFRRKHVLKVSGQFKAPPDSSDSAAQINCFHNPVLSFSSLFGLLNPNRFRGFIRPVLLA